MWKPTIRLAVLGLLGLPAAALAGGEPPAESDYYRMVTLPIPDDIVLEVGGLGWPTERKETLLVTTRRGMLWRVKHPYADPPSLPGDDASSANTVRYKRALFGLHEPLGLLTNPGHGFPKGIYTAQRAELTRLRDKDGDGRIDVVDSFCDAWEVSGSYHEYAFGPAMGKDGYLWVTLNRPFGGQPEGPAKWRGWAVKIDAKGNMHPVCPGLRSPAGLGANAAGDMFFTDNQGDHVAVCKLARLKEGVYHGQPVGLRSADLPKSTFEKPSEDYPKKGILWDKAVKVNPKLKAPAVWFPYTSMGKSSSDILLDTTGGKFGPFENQLFVGDQNDAIITRVFLEKVNGEYQGACFPFRSGFQCGVLRMAWGKDGSMFVGETDRGWGSRGSEPYGLERLIWTGRTPFEIHEMRARPDGFEVTFTKPVDPSTAGKTDSYTMKCWTYRYHASYGDKPRDKHALKITDAKVGSDHRSVRLRVEGLSPYYVHALKLKGVRSEEGTPLLHPEAYYTLNHIPSASESGS